jgi:hypothetical protein
MEEKDANLSHNKNLQAMLSAERGSFSGKASLRKKDALMCQEAGGSL